MTLVCQVDSQNQSAQVLTSAIPGFVASLEKRISELGSLKTWDFIKDISVQTLSIGVKIGFRKESKMDLRAQVWAFKEKS